MQIKPTNASDPNVRIANVLARDANIHTDVKYPRFVSDRYFSDAKFDELNRHVFGSEPTTRGPARIRELRATAAKEGLDPNDWFNNVEIIAGRKIGRETVDYVRNILKYWVAYHPALNLKENAQQPADPDKQTSRCRCTPDRPGQHRSVRKRMKFTIAVYLVLAACAKPLVPYSSNTPPLVLVPATQAGVIDKRGRFREIYCAVLEARRGLPDYRPCEQALTRVGEEPAGTAQPVELGPSNRRLVAAVVLGLGFDCIEEWLEPAGSVAKHVRRFGYDQVLIRVDALSSTANNARQIRDALLAMPDQSGLARVVLIGYSKGAPDILDAVVRYPEIHHRIAAVVSAAGAVGGSPLANDAKEYHANMLRRFPGAICEAGDGTAVASLRPAIRRAWLAANPLPADVRYYSLVTFPQPERISSVMKSSYRKLAGIDSRNDGQLIFYDQVIPGSHLMAYVNADHWALAVPIARTHSTIGAVFVTENAYPREALVEALLRFVEEDLSNRVRDH